jgi:hypothetical protein
VGMSRIAWASRLLRRRPTRPATRGSTPKVCAMG